MAVTRNICSRKHFVDHEFYGRNGYYIFQKISENTKMNHTFDGIRKILENWNQYGSNNKIVYHSNGVTVLLLAFEVVS